MQNNPIEELSRLAGVERSSPEVRLTAEAKEIPVASATPGATDPNLSAVTEELTSLAQALAKSTSAVSQNTDAIATNVSAVQNLGKSLLSKTTAGGLTGGSPLSFGLSPLVSLIGKLFGRNKPQTEVALLRFSLPDPLVLERGFSVASPSGGAGAVSYGQDGLPRAAAAGKTTQASAPQITFDVQAMDARSFLDHSSEIASALKSALLHSHDVTDVLSE